MLAYFVVKLNKWFFNHRRKFLAAVVNSFFHEEFRYENLQLSSFRKSPPSLRNMKVKEE